MISYSQSTLTCTMQFMKHVEPRLIKPRKPIVSLARIRRRRGLASSKFVSFGVGIHGCQLRLLLRSFASKRRLTPAISRQRVS